MPFIIRKQAEMGSSDDWSEVWGPKRTLSLQEQQQTERTCPPPSKCQEWPQRSVCDVITLYHDHAVAESYPASVHFCLLNYIKVTFNASSQLLRFLLVFVLIGMLFLLSTKTGTVKSMTRNGVTTTMKCLALRVRGHHSVEGLEAVGVAEEGDEDVAEVVQEVWWKDFLYTSIYRSIKILSWETVCE